MRIVYSDKKSKFEELLWRYDSVSTHDQNIKYLAIEMFKVFKSKCTQIAKGIFQFQETLAHQFKKQSDFQISYLHSVFNGTKCSTKCMKFFGPKI